MEAIELRIDSELEAGRAAELVPELEELVAEYPAREHLHAQVMLALHRAGRPEDAVAAYDRARSALLEELGLEPSSRLVELEAAILRRDPALLQEPAEIRARRHLPAQPTDLVGREREISEIVNLLAGGRRLVTLTGAGGIGKTRLALAAAEQLAAHYDDGVWFVDVSVVSDPTLVPSAVAQALGIVESPEQPIAAAVEEYVAEKRLLLVVDNFEQVGDAAPALSGLLRRAPQLALAVTSRVPLRLFEEEEYEVPPLDEASAVQLFAERARAVSRSFELNKGNARDIADVCVSLGGLPLAIELASATVRELAPAELRERLESSLDFLVGGPIDSPARQQTMRATIEWSYGLLGHVEQQHLAPLAVFSGGWSAEAASEVCGTTSETLGSLREKGMIFSVGERYGMLTPIREFAREALTSSEAELLAQRHAAYFTRLASGFDDRVRQHGFEPDNLHRFREDYENVRAALRWAHAAGETELFPRLAASFGIYSYVIGPYGEAREWLEIALAEPPEDAVLHGMVARSLGMVSAQQGDYHALGAAAERAVALFRSAGDTELEAKALNNAAIAALHRGDNDRARELAMQCRERTRALDDEHLQARMEHYVLNMLGGIELLEGRPREAERWWTECVVLCDRLREREGAATALMNLGLAALSEDRLADATARFGEGLRLADELQKVLTTANCVVGLAGVAAHAGEAARAGRLLGVTQRLMDDSGAVLEPYLAALFDETQATVRAELGEEGAGEVFALGRGDGPEAAVVYALEG